MAVLGAVLATPCIVWFYRTIGALDFMPPEVQYIGGAFCLVCTLIFMFTHRNADGTVRWTRPATRSASTAPQGKRTMLLIAAAGTLYWLLANLLHLSENMLSVARIVLGATIAVLCVRYVLRCRKPDIGIE
jgi:hypothetical protein